MHRRTVVQTPRGSIESLSGMHLILERAKLPVSNSNRVSHYQWLEEILLEIVEGRSQGIAMNAGTNERGSPLFVVAGACPNGMCGMQAVMYCKFGDAVAFWWIKPQKANPNQLERSTLSLNQNGPFKNTPGKAKAVYAPLGEKFVGVADGDVFFGVDDSGRAFIDELVECGERMRMLVYFIWQETWSSIMARTKFIEGKFCYQRGGKYFSRQYRCQDGQLLIMDARTEEELPSMLPPDSFQEMYKMD